ncbi:MAG TPA: hypothetical protein VN937_05075 [Blastocatellia bacterium]|nr:hypothetical protein [Blastocatellia bacterium]
MKIDLEYEYNHKDDDELLAIVHSQFFRPDAQVLARELLHERGISEDAISQWRDPLAEFTVTPWSGSPSDFELKERFKRHRRLNRISIYLVIIVSVTLGLLSALSSYGKSSSWPTLSRFTITFSQLAIILLGFRLYLWSRFWRRPLRILLFRPFAFPKSQKRIKHFTKHYLRYLGHTYTISDNVVKPRWAFLESYQFLLPILWVHRYTVYVLLPILLINRFQVSFLETSFIATVAIAIFLFLLSLTGWTYPLCRHFFQVRWDEDILRLKEFIGNRQARNIAWVLSWDKLFKISCTPETWKHTVQHFINSAQLIVVDLSNTGEGLEWELGELCFYGAINKAVFIAHCDSRDYALAVLKTHGLSESARRLFVYGDDGMAKNHEELCETIVSVVDRTATAN